MKTTSPLPNDLVRRYTAFRSGLELRKAMLGGYVPTVSRKRQAPLLEALVLAGLPRVPGHEPRRMQRGDCYHVTKVEVVGDGSVAVHLVYADDAYIPPVLRPA